MCNAEFKVGDIVSLAADAVYFDGKQMTSIIKSKRWIIHSISGSRIVLGTSEDGFYNLYAPVNVRYLNK